MSASLKKELITIGAAAVLLIIFALLPIGGILRFFLMLIPFLVSVYDVAISLYKKVASRNILSEYTAIALAALLAYIGGGYVEAVLVLLVFRLTSLFISFAKSKVTGTISRNIPASSERKSAKLPKLFMPILCGLALLVLIIKLIADVSQWRDALYTASVLLALSYPIAIVTSVPMAFLSCVKKLERSGAILGGHYVVERMARCTSVIFDKTGILATPFMNVKAAHPELIGEEALLTLVNIAIKDSSEETALLFKKAHPYSGEMKAERTEVLEGLGTIASVSGKIVSVGKCELMKKMGIEDYDAKAGESALHVAMGRVYLGCIVTGELVNEDAERSLYRLKAHGIRHIAMLSEDGMSETARVAETLHAVDDYYPDLTYAKKKDTVDKLLAANPSGTTALIGTKEALDLTADINFLFASAPCEGADVTVTDNRIENVPLSLHAADATILAVKENIIASLAIKFILTVLCITGVLGIFATFLIDTVVTVLTVLNALRLMIE